MRNNFGLGVIAKSVLCGSFALANSGCVTPQTANVPEYRDSIREVIIENDRDLRDCYYKAIDEKPMSEGKLVIGWTIDKEGKAADVKMKEADREIEHAFGCISEKLQSWSFPKPPTGESVVIDSYPFYFSEKAVR